MTVLKLKREIVYKKYDGHCAYCGVELNGKFQVDHCIPKANYVRVVANRLPVVPPHLKHLRISQCHDVDNLMPCCASCNMYKSSLDLETFRTEVGMLVQRLNARFTQYKVAKRFGMVREEETAIPIEFYFERHPKTNTFTPPNQKTK